MDKRTQSAVCVLPIRFQEALKKSPERILLGLEEIRIRANAPVLAYTAEEEYYLNESGLSFQAHDCFYPTDGDFITVLEQATKNSLYAYMEEIRNGFITIEGGHRIGICGTAVMKGEEITNIKDIRFITLRIAREIIGVSDSVINKIIENTQVRNTLIASPPQGGKTTLLRDIARNLSRIKNLKIALIDERGELSSVFKGVPQNQVGNRTFVLTGYPKKEGFSHAIRCLSPHVVIADEIGSKEDADSVFSAVYSGVKVITTAHGDRLSELKNREGFDRLFHQKIFQTLIQLNKSFPGRIESVLDGDWHEY